MAKVKKGTLATGWLKPNGKFEEVPGFHQELWASRHLISTLNDFTYYKHDIELNLQEKYNYMKFEDGVLMSTVWRQSGMEFTSEQNEWINENLAAIAPYTQKFLKELAEESLNE